MTAWIEKNGLMLRVIATAIAIVAWFWTQALIGARAPAPVIGDVIHDLTSGINLYLQQSPVTANALLIASSAFLDAIAVFLLARWVFAASVRPFLGLVLLLGLRQWMQALCALPPPPNMIWHYPGVPSLLVTYHVSYDYFFSGHTGIAVFGATELARYRKPWLTTLAVAVVLFEVTVVLVLRAHYTMDVFTGALAALWIAKVCDTLAPTIEQSISPARTDSKAAET
ncbi:MAG: phosphatase PAP2-related protein [Candidatus Acidiferrum sp.]